MTLCGSEAYGVMSFSKPSLAALVATLLATGDLVRTQAFRYGEIAWGTQFHLEVDRAEIDLWLKTAGDEGVRAWGTTREELEAQTDRLIDGHEERARALFGRFWGVVRAAV